MLSHSYIPTSTGARNKHTLSTTHRQVTFSGDICQRLCSLYKGFSGTLSTHVSQTTTGGNTAGRQIKHQISPHPNHLSLGYQSFGVGVLEINASLAVML